MPIGLSNYCEVGWVAGAPSHSVAGGTKLANSLPSIAQVHLDISPSTLAWPRTSKAARHALFSSFTGDDTLVPCTPNLNDPAADCAPARGAQDAVKCVESGDQATCRCIEGVSTNVSGVCVAQTCKDGAVAQKVVTQINNLEEKVNNMKDEVSAGSGGDGRVSPTSRTAKELGGVQVAWKDDMAKAPGFDSLKMDLASDASDVAASNIEYQPSLRSILRELGPVRLEAAVQDMTRGVHSILQANKSLQPGSIAMMTTSDAKMLDGINISIDKALTPLVQLRKILKSVKGNAALLGGKIDAWADAQEHEPQDEVREPGNVPPEEIVVGPAAAKAGESEEAIVEEMMTEETPNASELAHEREVEHDPTAKEITGKMIDSPAEKEAEKSTNELTTEMRGVPEIQAWAAVLQQVVSIHSAPPVSLSRQQRRVSAATFL